MIDYVIRNARVHGRGDTPADIGFEKGRIAAVEHGAGALAAPDTERPESAATRVS